MRRAAPHAHRALPAQRRLTDAEGGQQAGCAGQRVGHRTDGAPEHGYLRRAQPGPGQREYRAGRAEAFEQIGRGTIAPLVARMLDAIRTGAAPSPSLEDGLRAQLVLDAAAASAAGRTWIDIA